MQAVGVPGALRSLTENQTSGATVNALRFSDEFLWNWLIDGLFAVHLLGMTTWLADKKMFAIKAIRWLAGASFSLYLVHSRFCSSSRHLVRRRRRSPDSHHRSLLRVC